VSGAAPRPAARFGPSAFALAQRALVLSGLIARAAGLYLRGVLARRLGWRAARVEAEHWRRFARRFVATATRFRGALIKLGQVGSLRVEVLPDEVTAELASLRDRVAPHAFAEIAAQIERELGAPPDRVFARFDPEPLAAASLGQVHAATARDGRELAVKVLYPGIERSVAIDVAMAHVAMWLFDFAVVPDLMQVHREVRRSVYAELDYLQEASAAEEIARNLAADPDLARHVRVPAIHWDLTRRRVLCMEYVHGVKIADFEPGPDGSPSRETLVLRVTRAFLHMIFRDGFFHCDPHPGNLIVEPDGRLAIIDFGMHERLDPSVLEGVRRNVLASVTRDADLYARSLLEMGAVDAADLPVVREIAELSFDPAYYNLTPRELADLDLGRFAGELRGHLNRLHGFRLPVGVVMGSRALSVLYGLVVELAPGLRPLDVFGPYALAFLADASAAAPAATDRAASKSLESV
jgi:ubiquinone biosynthesis protein